MINEFQLSELNSVGYFLTWQRPDTIAVFGRNNESLLSIFGQPKAFWEQSGVCSDNSELEQHQSALATEWSCSSHWIYWYNHYLINGLDLMKLGFQIQYPAVAATSASNFRIICIEIFFKPRSQERNGIKYITEMKHGTRMKI